MAELVDIERGLRVRQIRMDREESQAEFAEALTRAAHSLGFSNRYTYNDISKRENARKTLDPEDYAAIALLDEQQRRGILWVMWGQNVTVGRDAWETILGPAAKRRGGGGGRSR